jgi:HEAT repeat protein
LAYGDYSSLVVTIAFWFASGVVATVLFLMAYIVVLRVLTMLRIRRHHAFMRAWREHLTRAMHQRPASLPRLSRRDRFSCLLLWNEMIEQYRSDPAATTRLRELLRSTDLDVVAERMLGRGGMRGRLIAAVTLGNLKGEQTWLQLEHFARSDHSLLALVAARSLMQINPRKAVSIFASLAARREDWPAASVAAVLKETGPGVVSEPVALAILGAALPEKQRLLPYLETCERETALVVAREALAAAEDDKIVTMCLRVIGYFRSIEDHGLALKYASHLRWHVRARAAWCLGRLAVPGDERVLSGLLADEQWWVRYRAAQALAAMPGIDTGDLLRLRGEQSDRYGRDILNQVIAERA